MLARNATRLATSTIAPAIGQRTDARGWDYLTRTERQVTQPSSFSNSLMSTVITL
jgi:hypothetical protein